MAIDDFKKISKKAVDNELPKTYNTFCQSRRYCGGHADVAQLVEQLIRNEQVVGSSPIISSI